MYTWAIRLVDVELDEDHPYTLKFSFVKSDERNGKTHKLIYSGANVEILGFHLDEQAEEKIKSQLETIFGRDKYNEAVVKEKFKNMEHLIKW